MGRGQKSDLSSQSFEGYRRLPRGFKAILVQIIKFTKYYDNKKLDIKNRD